VHEHAQLAAEAADAAGAHGKFWEMRDLLLSHQDALSTEDLIGYAREVGFDVELFAEKLRRRKYAPRVARDVESAEQSEVTGTPTFFANGRRHPGAYDLNSLTALVRSALSQTKESTPSSSHGNTVHRDANSG
jgi:protein-disulfide isomerase